MLEEADEIGVPQARQVTDRQSQICFAEAPGASHGFLCLLSTPNATILFPCQQSTVTNCLLCSRSPR
jgi:hypothetical protein